VIEGNITFKRRVLKCLKRARKRITKIENWTQFRQGESKDGYGVPPDSPSAARWCAVGAINHVCPSPQYRDFDDTPYPGIEARRVLSDVVAKKHRGLAVTGLNDRTHQPREVVHALVLKRFDDAIARVEKEIEKGAAKR
jgi:hypothetical protein